MSMKGSIMKQEGQNAMKIEQAEGNNAGDNNEQAPRHERMHQRGGPHDGPGHQRDHRGPRRGRGGPRGGMSGAHGGDDGSGHGSFGGHGGSGGGRGMGRGRGDRSHYLPETPTVSLEDALPPADKKFTGRCRLFVGNLPADTNEEDFKKMFEEHGEFTEVFLNSSRGFGFIRMDFRKNAEAAKAALDGVQKKGRTLRVRFATHGAALKVKFMPNHVSNELLAQAFSIFGELERAVIIVDDRGKPTGDGIVEFARKPGAQAALKRISEGVFMLGTSPRPVIVEPLEQKDEEDGYAEKFIQKTPEFNKEREQTPRFAPPGSFEFEFGTKWKDLFHMYEEQKNNLAREFESATAKLEIDQAGALMEHQTQMLRQDLLRRQEELRRLEEMHQMELQKRMDMRHQEDQRRRQDDDRRRDEMGLRRQQQEERMQQELYAQQERAMREMRTERGGHGNAPPMQPPPVPPAGLGVERGGSRQGGKPGITEHGHGSNTEEQNNSFGGNNAQNPPLRQSRFDQPPGYDQGHGGMGSGNGNMGGGHGNMMGMGRGGNMGNERMMERGGQRNRERPMREEYFEAKRPRQY